MAQPSVGFANYCEVKDGRVYTTHHAWNDEFCSCGQDTVTCQKCGRLICGNLTEHVPGVGNICVVCKREEERNAVQ
jgi:hypothetical protein